MIKKYKKGVSLQISKHFNAKEFHCHGIGCCSKTMIDTKLIDILEQTRSFFKKPIKINSGYRCSKHNASVKGNPNSSHVEGKAADIVVIGIAPKKVAQFLESIGVTNLGLYPDRVHVGSRSGKTFWLNDGKKSDYTITTFGGCPYKKPKRVSFGDKGNGVKYVQWWLRFRGIRGKNGKFLKVDGDYGLNTRIAVNNYRKLKGWETADYLKAKGIKELSR